MSDLIFVNGATGTVGREVMGALSRAGISVRAGSRSRTGREGNVEWVLFDPENPDTFASAFNGVRGIFLLTPVVQNMTALVEAMVQAAKQAGVQRLVRMSALGVELRPGFTLAWWHAAEKVVEESAIPYTILRPNSFQQNFGNMYGPLIREQNAWFGPMGDGRVSYVDVRDIADAAVQGFTDDRHLGQTYTLVGPQALSNSECAEIISRVVGRTVKYVDIAPSQMKEAMLKFGMPDWQADALLELFAVNKAGLTSVINNDIETVTGHPARGFEAYVKDNVEAFQARET